MENNLNRSEISIKQKVSFLKKNKLILIISIIFLSIIGLNYFVNSFTTPFVSSGVLAYNTRSIPGVSDNQDELFKLIGFDDKHISDNTTNENANNGIIKTKDGKYLFFSASKNGCSSSFSCTNNSYVINVDKKTISDFKIDSVLFNVTPVFGSLVVVQQEDSKKTLVYDSSKNIIIDTMEDSIGEYDLIEPFSNFLFGSDKYYTYTYKNILYSRDIAKHVSTPIGNFYDQEAVGIDNINLPSGFSNNGNIFYTLIYVNKYDNRPYSGQTKNGNFVAPKNDPLQLIAWNFKDNTSKVVTTQTLDLPASFKFVTNNSVLISGGKSRYGLQKDQTYLINLETGESNDTPQDNVTTDSNSTANITADRNVPRIMMWGGKVNQHWDLEKGVWLTDSDGRSGSELDKLTYCKKFYPNTISVVEYKNETIDTWKDGNNNYKNYTNTAMSYRCVLSGEGI